MLFNSGCHDNYYLIEIFTWVGSIPTHALVWAWPDHCMSGLSGRLVLVGFGLVDLDDLAEELDSI